MLVTIPVLPNNTRFLASDIQKWIPFFGLAAWLSGGCIFIAQGNLQKSRQSIETATGRIRRGCCLLVFPEGKRARTREILPFKKGVFHLTIAAGVPIVPIAISGAGDLMTPGSLAIRPGLVHVRFGAPIAPPHSISAEQLSVQTRAEVSELLAEIQRIAA
jgi:1-acyl-sn-glycerol-3-phosphate acyltransferase